MPVGKIFNAAENQVLFDPRAGKAVTLLLRNKELANQALEQEIELAPQELDIKRGKAAREAAAEKRAEEKASREAEKHLIEMADAEKEDARNANQAGLDAYESTKDIDKATEAWKIAAEAGPNTPGIEDIPPDWKFNPDVARAQNAVFDEDPTKPSSHVNMYHPESGKRISVRPDSPEADQASQDGYLVGGTGDKFLGIGETGTEIKASDESFILRMVGQHFGGLWDEKTGMVSFTDKTKQRRASQITTLAANLFSDVVTTSRADAVKRAMKAYGEKWEEPAGGKPEHEIGDILEKNGNKYRVTGFNPDGSPRVDKVPVG